jgi:hypothetical protein
MRKPGVMFLSCLCLLGLAMHRPALAQTTAPGQADIDALKKSAVKVYIDCGSCDIEYIKNEITFVNYVRDRNEAHVHVLITTLATGSGGREYTLTFIGQNEFADVKDVQKYFTSATDTEDEIRRGLVQALRLGLMSYVGRTPIASRIAINYAAPRAAGPVRDPWHFWVFSLSSDGSFSGQKSYKRNYLSTNFAANRVTERTKLQLSFYYSTSKRNYWIESEDRTVSGTSESWDGSGLFVTSLGGHWSAGGYVETASSFFNNVKLSLSLAPAVEYNFFPYAQSTRRQLRVLYRLAWNPVSYRETTQFGMLRETLWTESLSVSLDLREKWGTISTSVSGVNYLNHFTKGHIDTFGTISLNLYKGLNFFILGGWSLIHNQLSLRLRPPTDDEVYLRLVALQTNSSYFFAVGVQFTFGSIFTNVINPRFGSSRSGSMSVSID